MKEFFKKNWFKLIVLSILLFGCVSGFYYFYLIGEKNNDEEVYYKIGDVVKIDNYEIAITGLMIEDGANAHEERLDYFRALNWSSSDRAANYYKDTYKIIVPYINIKNLSKTETLRFEPNDFYLVTKSGFKYGHIQQSGEYEGGILIGGEIKSGYTTSGWYGFNLPKGYSEGNELYIQLNLPKTQKVLAYKILLY